MILTTLSHDCHAHYIVNTRHRASTALADISRSALCCHSNETRAPIANPPNSEQLESSCIIPPSYILSSGSVQ